ncbi:hypothetical protein RvY_03247 [Ramazzottius varieornatus]|uniref:Uncharacterized protein n=1 Tax=Ramazzottius varieornatus TaxID=947166 RepID=A0A1D1UN82_RAMVA|nr:hypothetical protein RvY_03247 [Ramazzottius varieornatus]
MAERHQPYQEQVLSKEEEYAKRRGRPTRYLGIMQVRKTLVGVGREKGGSGMQVMERLVSAIVVAGMSQRWYGLMTAMRRNLWMSMPLTIKKSNEAEGVELVALRRPPEDATTTMEASVPTSLFTTAPY